MTQMQSCILLPVGLVSQHAYQALRTVMADVERQGKHPCAGSGTVPLTHLPLPLQRKRKSERRAGEASMPTKHWGLSWQQ